MSRGGARPGAGRKPGTPNRVTAELQAAVAASGETPLDYMLRVMRDAAMDQPRAGRNGKGSCAVRPRQIGCSGRNASGQRGRVVTFTWLPPDTDKDACGGSL